MRSFYCKKLMNFKMNYIVYINKLIAQRQCCDAVVV
jgi:hypothetical protein